MNQLINQPPCSKYSILIIDDDVKVASLISKLLYNNNYYVFTASSHQEAKILIQNVNFNIILLDYMLEYVNGIDILNDLRKNNILIPVIMLTAVNQMDIKLNSLTLGVDDYIEKPFHAQELILRINNILKRVTPNKTSSIVSFCNMSFNKDTGELTKNNQIISLSTQEEQLLRIFIKQVGKIISKEDVLQSLGKSITLDNLNTINVNIMRLRKKIEEKDGNNQCLKTVRNQGFVLKP